MAEIRDVPGHAIETQACVVYDRRSGTVVHTHTFVPADPGSREEPSTLIMAASEAVANHAEREHLTAKIVPPSVFTPGASYRVDPESEAIELEEPGVDPAAMERRGGPSE